MLDYTGERALEALKELADAADVFEAATPFPSLELGPLRAPLFRAIASARIAIAAMERAKVER